MLPNTFFWCFSLSQIEDYGQYLEGPISTWKDPNKNIGVHLCMVVEAVALLWFDFWWTHTEHHPLVCKYNQMIAVWMKVCNLIWCWSLRPEPLDMRAELLCPLGPLLSGWLSTLPTCNHFLGTPSFIPACLICNRYTYLPLFLVCIPSRYKTTAQSVNIADSMATNLYGWLPSEGVS